MVLQEDSADLLFSFFPAKLRRARRRVKKYRHSILDIALYCMLCIIGCYNIIFLDRIAFPVFGTG